MERRTFGTEVRAEGRRLSGVVLAYGDVSPSHRERFEPGALRLADSVHLDLYHDPERAVAWFPGGGLELRQTRRALTMVATLPPIPAADRALEEVRSGRTTGLSVEFKSLAETRDGGLRLIQSAELRGIGLVRNPSYQQSQVEARRRSGRTMRAKIPADTDLACECSGAGCKFARFSKEALEELFERTFERFEREAVASFGSYAAPVASVSRGTMRGRMVGDGLEVDIDLPDSAAGVAVLAAHEDAGVVARPFLDAEQSEGQSVLREDGENAMAYTKATLRAVIISSTDAREGWPEPQLVATPEEMASSSSARTRRLPSWL